MGRNAWTARYSGGAALLCAVLALWWTVLGAGVSVYRPEAIALAAAALLLAAGWVWSASGPVQIAPPREVEPVPAPPARLPWRRSSRFLPWLFCVVVVLPAVAVIADLATRTEGEHLRRIAAIQKAGAEVAQGKIVAVRRLTAADSRTPLMSGDVTVSVPLRSRGGGIIGNGRVEVVDGYLGRQDALSLSQRTGAAFDGPNGPSSKPVPVLYAPTAPELGGFVDTRDNNLDRYVKSGSAFAFSPPHWGGQAVLACGGLVLLVWALALIPSRRDHAAALTLRADASGGAALPAVRARITAARRDDHTSLGDVDGTVRVTSDHTLRFELEDGSEAVAGNRAVRPHALAFLAARTAGRPGWLCGARNWRLIRNEQPVFFVTDEGEAAWLSMDREEFERVLAPAVPVQPDPERRTVLSPAPTTVVPGAHWPWLGGLLLSYGLIVLVLTVPMPWGASLGTAVLAAAAVVAAFVVLVRRGEQLSHRAGRWEVHETRDPELGPA